MKKYKVKFAFANLFNESGAEIVKLQSRIKIATVTLASTAFVASNDRYALLVGILGLVLDTLVACLSLEEIK